jgi:hypothetical protein
MGGTVASDPRETAAFGPKEFEESVLCHSFSWGGMSGSPVFASFPKESLTWDDVEEATPRELLLVGVNCGHVKAGGSAEGAVTYFAKSTALGRLLERAGARGVWRPCHDADEDQATGAEAPL